MKDPLEILVKSSEEIEQMKKSGNLYSRHIIKRFGIKCGKRIIEKSFITLEEAESWAEWNYKGTNVWMAIILPNF